MKRVLFVDDEPNVLQGLRRMLRPMRNEWDMHFAEGPENALRELEAVEFHVVVTDMRMPNMDGADLLKRVLSYDPGIARIILSGQTDKEAALRSTGTAHQFLAKPCEAEDLKRAVQRACQLRDLMKDDRIQRAVAGFGALPSLPKIYKELTDEMESDEMSLKRIGEIVARDISLTAKILQLVNSAFFGLPRHVENVGQAISFLGAETLRSLVLSTSVFKSFDAGASEFNPEALWKHSFAVGSVALALARAETPNKAVADEALQAGMLHDIGHLIIAAGIPDQYREIVQIARGEGKAMHEAEVDVLGCEHAQIGAYLMGLWGLPDGIVEAIAFHHDTDAVPGDDFTPHAAVYAANQLAHAYMDSTEGVDDALLADLGVLESHPDKRSVWFEITKKTLGLADAA